MKINKIILVCAMSRSGHHAIIDWLYAQYKDNRIFLNYGDIAKPFLDFENRVQYYCNKNKYYRKISESWIKYNLLEEKIREFKKEDVQIEDRVLHEDKNICIVNFENPSLFEIQKHSDTFPREKYLNTTIQYVLVIRDILNIVASKIKSGRELNIDDLGTFKIDSIIGLWKEYAHEYLKNTHYLRSSVTINFNKWFTHKYYREEISKLMKTNIYIDQWDELSTFGGGSSFDQYRYRGEASDMKVLDRWSEYSMIPFFMDIWNNDYEIRELSRKIFGKLPYDIE